MFLSYKFKFKLYFLEILCFQLKKIIPFCKYMNMVSHATPPFQKLSFMAYFDEFIESYQLT